MQNSHQHIGTISDKKRLKNKGIHTLCISTLMCSLALSSVNIALPELAYSLQTNFLDVQWVIIAFMFSLTCTLVIAGSLSDIYGRKKLFLIGILIFTLACSVAPLVQSLWALVVMRLGQGIGSGILLTSSMALAADIVSKNKLSSIIALLASVSAVGTGLGPIMGGVIIEYAGWQPVFLANIPLGIGLYIYASKYLPSNVPKAKKHFSDFTGACLLLITLLTYTLAITLTSQGFNLLNCLLLIISFVTLQLFLAHQKRSYTAMINVALINTPSFLLCMFSSFIVSIFVMASLVIGPFYLIYTLNLSAATAGLVMAVSPSVVASMSFILSQSLVYLSLRARVLSGLSILLLGALCMAHLKVEYGVVGYILCLTVTALGYALFLSANNTLAMQHANSKNRGAASGTLNLARNLGLLSGTSIMSRLFTVESQAVNFYTTQYQTIEASLHITYLVGAALLLIVIIVQLKYLFYKKSHSL
ncbi:Riboflavin transporter RibZ [Pseudoalteromonas sp. CIP111854]|uniref:Riboflavin transporter RibZ n=1 Tax=Pseudoalteromonas holothuriae TaxID=2963714 RepID=A0A9W4QW17_9GAMM|nr:MFS transporter [Pseudoalteromonas sp. CIP111854]CAH9055813.1 Riboflavin transporter RibZ [Pseudoalteromonas sp. CIP111854]